MEFFFLLHSGAVRKFHHLGQSAVYYYLPLKMQNKDKQHPVSPCINTDTEATVTTSA